MLELGTWTPSTEEIIAFGERWDPLPFHVDPERAAGTAMGGLIASGVHTMAIFQRLAVDGAWSHFALVIGREFSFRLRAPVRPGMTLRATIDWEQVTPRARGRAHVDFIGRLRDESGAVLFEMHGNVVLGTRPTG